MIEFDNPIEPECNPGSPGVVNSTTCQTSVGPSDPPSDDPRCEDPAFSEANPDLCRGYPRLILKPEYALVESGGTVQYRTFLRTGGNEVELLQGLEYAIASVQVAVIHRTNGLATGVAPGISTVSVEWQDKHAFAEIEVVNTCADVQTQFLLLFDDSKSSKAGFNGIYSSRLVYAKEAARQFVSTVNFSKDKVAVAKFGVDGAIVLDLSQDQAAINSAIAGIASTDEHTDIASGLTAARDYLATTGTGTKVIVLFSDGENNEGDDPVSISNAWKNAGNIIVVVALRAWGEWFDLLYRIASDGFFLSAYDATAFDVITTLKGLKTYLCSGDCQPQPGTYPKAKLNYRDFTNWDVFQGNVDLVGLGLWDVQPGHGLYVDLAGTQNQEFPSPDMISPGGIITKNHFTFVAGQQYRFQIKVAGNNVGGVGPDEAEAVRVRIIKDDDTTLLDQTITPTSREMAFTNYTFNFTPGAGASARIRIEMVSSNDNNIGPLIDDIVLQNITTSTLIFSDDFDDENQVTVPEGYGYYGPCLETPPGAQTADPNPPTVLES